VSVRFRRRVTIAALALLILMAVVAAIVR